MGIKLNEVDKVEVLTLQDNYIDLVARDSNEVVQRANPLKGNELGNSIRAEHGFSTWITITKNGTSRYMLFDFGFSEDGAALNAKALNADLSQVEALVLSHGHLDHLGGLENLVAAVGKKDLDLVVHPGVFVKPRYRKITEDFRVIVPSLSREKSDKAGVNIVETQEPYLLLDGDGLFLGEIPRVTDFEKGAPDMFYQVDGEEKHDSFHDDSGIAFNIKEKGLVVISGCAHAGIVNTVKYAQMVTGVTNVWAVMGGFHLSGADFDGVISPTTGGLKEINPHYVIPTHCTGRDAVMHIEREMPDAFLLNMSGTKMTFA
ncbi:MAG: MBL fold metallo-hydrolase [Deltaproteobacteria bacterium]|nr:MAG: MBL fold metallo-hydrolase [Deltaproteobacteria bacterium]